MNGSMDLLNEGSFLVSTEESIALLRRVPAPVWTKERFFLQYNFVQQCKNMQLYCKVAIEMSCWGFLGQSGCRFHNIQRTGHCLKSWKAAVW
jgi:hypothetical protein